MKVINFAAAAAAMLVFPVLLCSCNTAKTEKKPEVQTAKPEVKEEVKPVEVKAGTMSEPAKAEPAPAPKPAKAEPAPAPKPAKAEPAPAQKPAKAEAQKVELPCSHTVKTGDNLWKISKRYYGSGSDWKKIYEANKQQIGKPDFLEPGTVLNIPAK